MALGRRGGKYMKVTNKNRCGGKGFSTNFTPSRQDIAPFHRPQFTSGINQSFQRRFGKHWIGHEQHWKECSKKSPYGHEANRKQWNNALKTARVGASHYTLTSAEKDAIVNHCCQQDFDKSERYKLCIYNPNPILHSDPLFKRSCRDLQDNEDPLEQNIH